jgi:hypothetical protein
LETFLEVANNLCTSELLGIDKTLYGFSDVKDGPRAQDYMKIFMEFDEDMLLDHEVLAFKEEGLRLLLPRSLSLLPYLFA